MGASLEALIPELQEPAGALYDLAARAGVQPRITSTVRTRAEQSRLYRRFLSGGSAFPAAPPGLSAHEYGYAFDMVVAGEENQFDLGSVWQSWGGVWSRKDFVHFEYPGFKPPASIAPERPVGQQVEASVGDFILGFIPVFGGVSMAASVLEMLGFSHSEAVHWLSSPLSSLAESYPNEYRLLKNLLPTGSFF